MRLSPPTTSSESLLDRFHQLKTLTAQADKLAEEQATYTRRTKELEGQIQKGELACGRMLQQALELQNAIDIRKRHVQEDERKLNSELSSRESKIEQIRLIVSRINVLTMEMNAGVCTGDARQVGKFDFIFKDC